MQDQEITKLHLQNAIHQIINSTELEEYKEAMIIAVCQHAQEKYSEESIKDFALAVIDYNLEHFRQEAVDTEEKVDMLMRIKETI